MLLIHIDMLLENGNLGWSLLLQGTFQPESVLCIWPLLGAHILGRHITEVVREKDRAHIQIPSSQAISLELVFAQITVLSGSSSPLQHGLKDIYQTSTWLRRDSWQVCLARYSVILSLSVGNLTEMLSFPITDLNFCNFNLIICLAYGAI